MKKHTPPAPELASQKELNDFLLHSLNANLTQAIKSTVSIMVKAEMRILREDLGQEKQTSFNGYYGRNLVSPVGKIEGIPIPRFRGGNDNLELQSMNVFADEQERFFGVVQQMHLVGISQRKINRFCKNIFGKAVAPQTTKVVFEEMLEQEAFQVNKVSLIEKPQTFLFLDGIWQTVKSNRTGEASKRVVLMALGMNEQGEKQILGFHLAFAEDEKSWKEFIESLQKRGLNTSTTKLVIADDGKGLQAALERIAPQTPLQICITHKYRNVLTHTPRNHKAAMGGDLQQLTKTRSKEEFITHAKDMEKRWLLVAPDAVKSLTSRIDLVTAYFSFPEHLWSRIRTTNILERTLREVRSRTAVMQHQFTSPESAVKYHQAIVGNLNQTYLKNRTM
jgi:putative transposase